MTAPTSCWGATATRRSTTGTRTGSAYPASECPMLLPRTTGETVTSELDWFFRRDGSMFPVSYVSVPIDLPEGRGAVVAFTDIEAQTCAEQSLREREAGLAEQQAALRRVAALVAGDAARPMCLRRSPARSGGAGDASGAVVALRARRHRDRDRRWSERPHPFQAGTRWPLEGPRSRSSVRETGRPARLDDLTVSRARSPRQFAGPASARPRAPRSSSAGGFGALWRPARLSVSPAAGAYRTAPG